MILYVLKGSFRKSNLIKFVRILFYFSSNSVHDTQHKKRTITLLWFFFYHVMVVDSNRSEASLANAQQGVGVASVGRPAGGRPDADRDNERVGWPTREAEIQVSQPYLQNRHLGGFLI